VSVIICGIDRGTTHKYKCPGCDFQSDDIEQFATSCCWTCVYGDDEDEYYETDVPPSSLDADPCVLCGEAGACGWDLEGRPLIHAISNDDAREDS
jgi:hypothetical protein